MASVISKTYAKDTYKLAPSDFYRIRTVTDEVNPRGGANIQTFKLSDVVALDLELTRFAQGLATQSGPGDLAKPTGEHIMKSNAANAGYEYHLDLVQLNRLKPISRTTNDHSSTNLTQFYNVADVKAYWEFVNGNTITSGSFGPTPQPKQHGNTPFCKPNGTAIYRSDVKKSLNLALSDFNRLRPVSEEVKDQGKKIPKFNQCDAEELDSQLRRFVEGLATHQGSSEYAIKRGESIMTTNAANKDYMYQLDHTQLRRLKPISKKRNDYGGETKYFNVVDVKAYWHFINGSNPPIPPLTTPTTPSSSGPARNGRKSSTSPSKKSPHRRNFRH